MKKIKLPFDLSKKSLKVLEKTYLLPALREFRKWRNKEFIKPVAHQDIIGLVIEDGRMTSRYSFMIVMSCAIAILGLLLSSPAVVIGAMLISPLMGPIMSLGFSLCVVDYRQMRKSLEALAIGTCLALAISMIIVFFSPLTDATPEIMARTKPNLFDLLVAVFSGLAGGYATIKQKGATIVGVAIATALMPPLAVVGYGVATVSWSIAGGAFFLFMTNLLAIALSVTLLAKWYGFGEHHSPVHTLRKTLAVFAVFILLSIPLGISLSKIAYQAYATKTAQFEIDDYFKNYDSRIANFDINFKDKENVVIDTVIVTTKYQPDAQNVLAERLSASLDTNVLVSVDQIIVAREQVKDQALAEAETLLRNNIQNRLAEVDLREDMINSIRSTAFFPLEFINIDQDQKIISVSPASSDELTISLLREFENNLRTRFPEWTVMVVPNTQTLPTIYFDVGESELNDAALNRIDDAAWALRRWNINDVLVMGYASTLGGSRSTVNRQLAFDRASNVANILNESGVETSLRSEFGRFDQSRDERDYGMNSLHKVEIRFNSNSIQ